MFLKATVERRGTPQSRLSVPWLAVVPLAVVLAFADGFWITSLRGAVGAIERTQGPFAAWLHESILALPAFAFAVIAALTLALHLFGPVLRTSRAVVTTALLIAAAGTMVGIAELAASSAYDYHLQSRQLQLMDSMRQSNVGSSLAQQQQATLGLQVHAVAYGAVILLATNLVLVGWVVAMRGGRLKVSTIRQRATRPLLARSTRVDDLLLFLAAGLVGSAAIHAAVVPQHLTEWAAAGVFFIVLVAAELAVAALLFARPQPRVLFAAATVSLGPLALWLYSRTVGMPFGPGVGSREQIGLPDGAACVLEVITLITAVVLLRGGGWLRRPAVSAHARSLALVAVIAVAAVGLAGSGLAGFDYFGGAGGQSAMVAAP
jgi:hypothetical protein